MSQKSDADEAANLVARRVLVSQTKPRVRHRITC